MVSVLSALPWAAACGDGTPNEEIDPLPSGAETTPAEAAGGAAGAPFDPFAGCELRFVVSFDEPLDETTAHELTVSVGAVTGEDDSGREVEEDALEAICQVTVGQFTDDDTSAIECNGELEAEIHADRVIFAIDELPAIAHLDLISPGIEQSVTYWLNDGQVRADGGCPQLSIEWRIEGPVILEDAP